MCKWYGDYIKTPLTVGDKLEAGTYARDDSGRPLNTKVYLKGYNPETQKFLTFAETIPDPATGWAGMPMITLTDAHVGTWRMNWDAPGANCGSQASGADLVVTKVPTPIYLSSDKISVQQGDTVTFTGKYKPNENVNIYEPGIVRNHITEAKCDAQGDFIAVVYNLNLAAAPGGTLHKIQACSAGWFGVECSLLPDTSGDVYITVHPRQACSPVWRCIDPFNGIESDGCGHTRPNPACNPPLPGDTPGDAGGPSDEEATIGTILAMIAFIAVLIFIFKS